MSAVARARSGCRKQAERELWTLRDEVLRLEEELTVSRAQLDKVTRQFNSLVELLHKYVWFSVCMSVSVCQDSCSFKEN